MRQGHSLKVGDLDLNVKVTEVVKFEKSENSLLGNGASQNRNQTFSDQEKVSILRDQ